MQRFNTKSVSILFKKAVACALALMLCFQGYGAQAATNAAPVSVGLEQKVVSLLNVNIPQAIGSIKEKFDGQTGKVVFIIQDAHAIPEAQRSIHQLIEFSEKEYGVGVVALEGAASDLDAQIFKSFPDKERLKKVFEGYFERGELTGGTAAALFSETPSLYHGIEDWELYQEGLGYFLEAAQLEATVTPQLHSLFEQLKAEKQKNYSGQLFAIDQALRGFHQNAADLMGVLEKLAAIEPPQKDSELALLLEEMGHSQENDSALELEVKQIAEQIRAALIARKTSPPTKQALLQFNQKFQEFQTAQITPEAMALFLKGISIEHRIRVRVSKRLNARVGQQKRMKDIEGTQLFEDFENYAESVKKSLFRNHEERLLDLRNHLLELVERLTKLELSRPDWTKLKAALIKMDAWTISQDGVDRQGEIAALLKKMKAPIDFYHNAEKRDQVFMRQTEMLFKKHDAKAITLVAGGFHAEGITELLRAKGISYALIMPAIKSMPDETNYRDHMQGKVTWGEYFEVENGKVNLYNAFVRGARDKLLASSGQRPADRGASMLTANRYTLKSWRDQIIRDLADQNKIAEAGEYTRFIDEVVEAEGVRQRADGSVPWRRRGEATGKSSAAQNDLIAQWRANVDQFVTGLRQLNEKNQLSEKNIAALLPGTAMSDPATYTGAFNRSEIRVGLMPRFGGGEGRWMGNDGQSAAKSEVRTGAAKDQDAVFFKDEDFEQNFKIEVPSHKTGFRENVQALLHSKDFILSSLRDIYPEQVFEDAQPIELHFMGARHTRGGLKDFNVVTVSIGGKEFQLGLLFGKIEQKEIEEKKVLSQNANLRVPRLGAHRDAASSSNEGLSLRLLATEYIPGATLWDLLAEGQYETAFNHYLDVALSLFNEGIKIKDLTPANVVLNPQGAYLVDHGAFVDGERSDLPVESNFSEPDLLFGAFTKGLISSGHDLAEIATALKKDSLLEKLAKGAAEKILNSPPDGSKLLESQIAYIQARATDLKTKSDADSVLRAQLLDEFARALQANNLRDRADETGRTTPGEHGEEIRSEVRKSGEHWFLNSTPADAEQISRILGVQFSSGADLNTILPRVFDESSTEIVNDILERVGRRTQLTLPEKLRLVIALVNLYRLSGSSASVLEQALEILKTTDMNESGKKIQTQASQAYLDDFVVKQAAVLDTEVPLVVSILEGLASLVLGTEGAGLEIIKQVNSESQYRNRYEFKVAILSLLTEYSEAVKEVKPMTADLNDLALVDPQKARRETALRLKVLFDGLQDAGSSYEKSLALLKIKILVGMLQDVPSLVIENTEIDTPVRLYGLMVLFSNPKKIKADAEQMRELFETLKEPALQYLRQNMSNPASEQFLYDTGLSLPIRNFYHKTFTAALWALLPVIEGEGWWEAGLEPLSAMGQVLFDRAVLDPESDNAHGSTLIYGLKMKAALPVYVGVMTHEWEHQNFAFRYGLREDGVWLLLSGEEIAADLVTARMYEVIADGDAQQAAAWFREYQEQTKYERDRKKLDESGGITDDSHDGRGWMQQVYELGAPNGISTAEISRVAHDSMLRMKRGSYDWFNRPTLETFIQTLVGEMQQEGIATTFKDQPSPLLLGYQEYLPPVESVTTTQRIVSAGAGVDEAGRPTLDDGREADARSEVRAISRRGFLGAAVTAGVSAYLGSAVIPEIFKGVRAENISRARRERAKREQPHRQRPWLSFKSNAEQPFHDGNIRHDLLVILDWLVASGYPNADVLDQYAGALERKITIDEQESAPMKKVYDPKINAYQIVVNPQALYWELLAVKEANSRDVLVGSLAFMLVRESWGLQITTNSDFIDRGDEAVRKIIAVEESRKAQRISLREIHPETPAFSAILEDQSDKIKESLDFYLSTEVYEALREWEFIDWAQKQGLFDAQKFESDYAALRGSPPRSLKASVQSVRVSLKSRGNGSVIINNQLRGLSRDTLEHFNKVFSNEMDHSGRIILYNLYLAAKEGLLSTEVLDQGRQGLEPAYKDYQAFTREIAPRIKGALTKLESELSEQERILPRIEQIEAVSQQGQAPQRKLAADSEVSVKAKDETPEEEVTRRLNELNENIKKQEWMPASNNEESVPDPDDLEAFNKWMEANMRGEKVGPAPLVRSYLRSEVRTLGVNQTVLSAGEKVLDIAEVVELRKALSSLGFTVQETDLNAFIFNKRLNLKTWLKGQPEHESVADQAAMDLLKKIHTEAKVRVGMRIFKARMTLWGEDVMPQDQQAALYGILQDQLGVHFDFQNERIIPEGGENEVSPLTKLTTRDPTTLPPSVTQTLDQWMDTMSGVIGVSGGIGRAYETKELLFGNEDVEAAQVLFQFDYFIDDNGEAAVEVLPPERRFRPFQKHESDSGVRKLRAVLYVRDNRLYLLVGDLQGDRDTRDPVPFYRNFTKIGQYIADQFGQPVILDQETVILKGRPSGLGLVQVKPTQSLIKRLWIRDIQPLGGHVENLSVPGIDPDLFNHYQGRFDAQLSSEPSETELADFSTALGEHSFTHDQLLAWHRAVERVSRLIKDISREQIIQKLAQLRLEGPDSERLLNSQDPRTLIALTVLAAAGRNDIVLADVEQMESSIDGDGPVSLGFGIVISYWITRLNQLPSSADQLDLKRKILNELITLALKTPFFAPGDRHYFLLENYLLGQLIRLYKSTDSWDPEQLPEQFKNPEDAAIAAKIARLSIRGGPEASNYQKFLNMALHSSAESLKSFIETSADDNELVDRILSLQVKENNDGRPDDPNVTMLIQAAQWVGQNLDIQARLRSIFNQPNVSINAQVIILSLMRENDLFLWDVIGDTDLAIHTRLIAASHYGMVDDDLINTFDRVINPKARFRDAVKDAGVAPAVMVQSQSVVETTLLAKSMGSSLVSDETLRTVVRQISETGGIYYHSDYVTGEEVNNANDDFRVGNDLLDQKSLDGVGEVLRHEAAHNFSEYEIPTFEGAHFGEKYDTFFAGASEIVSNLAELARREGLQGPLTTRDIQEIADTSVTDLHETISQESRTEGHDVARSTLLRFSQTKPPETVDFRPLFLSVFEYLKSTAYDVSDRPELETAKARVEKLHDLLLVGTQRTAAEKKKGVGTQLTTDDGRGRDTRSELRTGLEDEIKGLAKDIRSSNEEVKAAALNTIKLRAASYAEAAKSSAPEVARAILTLFYLGLKADVQLGNPAVGDISIALADIGRDRSSPKYLRLMIAERIPKLQQETKTRNLLNIVFNSVLDEAMEILNGLEASDLEKKYALALLEQTIDSQNLTTYPEVKEKALKALAPGRIEELIAAMKLFDLDTVIDAVHLLKQQSKTDKNYAGSLQNLLGNANVQRDIRGYAADQLIDLMEAGRVENADMVFILKTMASFSNNYQEAAYRAQMAIDARENSEIINHLKKLKGRDYALGYVVLKKHAKNNEAFLRTIVADESLDIHLRIFAYGLAFEYFGKAETGPDFLKKVEVLLQEFARDRTLGDGVSMVDLSAILSSPLGKYELQTINLTLLIQVRGHLNDIVPLDSFYADQIRRQMSSRIVRGYDNATGEQKYGSQFMKGMDGEGFLLVVAHELMHNMTEFGLGYAPRNSKNRLAVHELLSDLFALAFAESMGWEGESFFRKMNFRFEFNSVSKPVFQEKGLTYKGRAAEEHSAARAVLWDYGQSVSKTQVSGRWAKAFFYAVETLKKDARYDHNFTSLTRGWHGRLNPELGESVTWAHLPVLVEEPQTRSEVRMTLFDGTENLNKWLDGLEARGVYGEKKAAALVPLYQEALKVLSKEVEAGRIQSFEDVSREAVYAINDSFRDPKRVPGFNNRIKAAKAYVDEGKTNVYSQLIFNAMAELPVFYDANVQSTDLRGWLGQYYQFLIERGLGLDIETRSAQSVLALYLKQLNEGQGDRPLNANQQNMVDRLSELESDGIAVPVLVLQSGDRRAEVPMISADGFSSDSHMHYTIAAGKATIDWVVVEPIWKATNRGERSFIQIGSTMAHEIDHAIFRFLFETDLQRRYQEGLVLEKADQEFLQEFLDRAFDVKNANEKDGFDARYEQHNYSMRAHQFEEMTANVLSEGLARRVQRVFDDQQEAGILQHNDIALESPLAALVSFPTAFERVAGGLEIGQLSYTLGEIMIEGLVQEGEAPEEFYLSARYDDEIVRNHQLIKMLMKRYFDAFDSSAVIYDQHADKKIRGARIIVEAYVEAWLSLFEIKPADFILHEHKAQLLTKAVSFVESLSEEELLRFIEELKPQVDINRFATSSAHFGTDKQQLAKYLYRSVLEKRALKEEWKTLLSGIPTARELTQQEAAQAAAMHEQTGRPTTDDGRGRDARSEVRQDAAVDWTVDEKLEFYQRLEGAVDEVSVLLMERAAGLIRDAYAALAEKYGFPAGLQRTADGLFVEVIVQKEEGRYPESITRARAPIQNSMLDALMTQEDERNALVFHLGGLVARHLMALTDFEETQKKQVRELEAMAQSNEQSGPEGVLSDMNSGVNPFSSDVLSRSEVRLKELADRLQQTKWVIEPVAGTAKRLPRDLKRLFEELNKLGVKTEVVVRDLVYPNAVLKEDVDQSEELTVYQSREGSAFQWLQPGQRDRADVVLTLERVFKQGFGKRRAGLTAENAREESYELAVWSAELGRSVVLGASGDSVTEDSFASLLNRLHQLRQQQRAAGAQASDKLGMMEKVFQGGVLLGLAAGVHAVLTSSAAHQTAGMAGLLIAGTLAFLVNGLLFSVDYGLLRQHLARRDDKDSPAAYTQKAIDAVRDYIVPKQALLDASRSEVRTTTAAPEDAELTNPQSLALQTLEKTAKNLRVADTVEEAYELQEDAPGYRLLQAAAKQIFRIAGSRMDVLGLAQRAFQQTRFVWTESIGSSFAHPRSEQTYIEVSMGWAGGVKKSQGYISEIAKEAGHALHFAAGLYIGRGKENISRGVAEAYDSLVHSIIEDELNVPGWRKSLEDDALIGRVFVQFMATNPQFSPVLRGNNGWKDFFTAFLARLSVSIGADTKEDVVAHLKRAAKDADYGFDHLIGAYVLQTVLQNYDGNLDAAAQVLGLALRHQEGISFHDPIAFIGDLEVLPAKYLNEKSKNYESLGLWALAMLNLRQVAGLFTRGFVTLWSRLAMKFDIGFNRLEVLRKSIIKEGLLIEKGGAQMILMMQALGIVDNLEDEKTPPIQVPAIPLTGETIQALKDLSSNIISKGPDEFIMREPPEKDSIINLVGFFNTSIMDSAAFLTKKIEPRRPSIQNRLFRVLRDAGRIVLYASRQSVAGLFRITQQLVEGWNLARDLLRFKLIEFLIKREQLPMPRSAAEAEKVVVLPDTTSETVPTQEAEPSIMFPEMAVELAFGLLQQMQETGLHLIEERLPQVRADFTETQSAFSSLEGRPSNRVQFAEDVAVFMQAVTQGDFKKMMESASALENPKGVRFNSGLALYQQLLLKNKILGIFAWLRESDLLSDYGSFYGLAKIDRWLAASLLTTLRQRSLGPEDFAKLEQGFLKIQSILGTRDPHAKALMQAFEGLKELARMQRPSAETLQSSDVESTIQRAEVRSEVRALEASEIFYGVPGLYNPARAAAGILARPQLTVSFRDQADGRIRKAILTRAANNDWTLVVDGDDIRGHSDDRVFNLGNEAELNRVSPLLNQILLTPPAKQAFLARPEWAPLLNFLNPAAVDEIRQTQLSELTAEQIVKNTGQVWAKATHVYSKPLDALALILERKINFGEHVLPKDPLSGAAKRQSDEESRAIRAHLTLDALMKGLLVDQETGVVLSGMHYGRSKKSAIEVVIETHSEAMAHLQELRAIALPADWTIEDVRFKTKDARNQQAGANRVFEIDAMISVAGEEPAAVYYTFFSDGVVRLEFPDLGFKIQQNKSETAKLLVNDASDEVLLRLAGALEDAFAVKPFNLHGPEKIALNRELSEQATQWQWLLDLPDVPARWKEILKTSLSRSEVRTNGVQRDEVPANLQPAWDAFSKFGVLILYDKAAGVLRIDSFSFHQENNEAFWASFLNYGLDDQADKERMSKLEGLIYQKVTVEDGRSAREKIMDALVEEHLADGSLPLSWDKIPVEKEALEVAFDVAPHLLEEQEKQGQSSQIRFDVLPTMADGIPVVVKTNKQGVMDEDIKAEGYLGFILHRLGLVKSRVFSVQLPNGENALAFTIIPATPDQNNPGDAYEHSHLSRNLILRALFKSDINAVEGLKTPKGFAAYDLGLLVHFLQKSFLGFAEEYNQKLDKRLAEIAAAKTAVTDTTRSEVRSIKTENPYQSPIEVTDSDHWDAGAITGMANANDRRAELFRLIQKNAQSAVLGRSADDAVLSKTEARILWQAINFVTEEYRAFLRSQVAVVRPEAYESPSSVERPSFKVLMSVVMNSNTLRIQTKGLLKKITPSSSEAAQKIKAILLSDVVRQLDSGKRWTGPYLDRLEDEALIMALTTGKSLWESLWLAAASVLVMLSFAAGASYQLTLIDFSKLSESKIQFATSFFGSVGIFASLAFLATALNLRSSLRDFFSHRKLLAEYKANLTSAEQPRAVTSETRSEVRKPAAESFRPEWNEPLAHYLNRIFPTGEAITIVDLGAGEPETQARDLEILIRNVGAEFPIQEAYAVDVKAITRLVVQGDKIIRTEKFGRNYQDPKVIRDFAHIDMANLQTQFNLSEEGALLPESLAGKIQWVLLHKPLRHNFGKYMGEATAMLDPDKSLVSVRLDPNERPSETPQGLLGLAQQGFDVFQVDPQLIPKGYPPVVGEFFGGKVQAPVPVPLHVALRRSEVRSRLFRWNNINVHFSISSDKASFADGKSGQPALDVVTQKLKKFLTQKGEKGIRKIAHGRPGLDSISGRKIELDKSGSYIKFKIAGGEVTGTIDLLYDEPRQFGKRSEVRSELGGLGEFVTIATKAELDEWKATVLRAAVVNGQIKTLRFARPENHLIELSNFREGLRDLAWRRVDAAITDYWNRPGRMPPLAARYSRDSQILIIGSKADVNLGIPLPEVLATTPPSKRSEVRLNNRDKGAWQEAATRSTVTNLLTTLRPGAEENLSAPEIEQIYKLSSDNINRLIETILAMLNEIIKELDARKEEAQTPTQLNGVLGLRATIGFAKQFLTAVSTEGLPENITFAIDFLPASDREAFLSEIIKGVSALGIKAEVLSDADTHQSFAKKITQSLRSLLRLKKLTPKDLRDGTVVSEEGLGVVTALNDIKKAEGLNKIFQGVFFNGDDMSQDPDSQLAGQILFATFLIKLAIISASPENKAKNPADRTEFLKAAFIRAIQEAGYSAATSKEALDPKSGGLISIMGKAFINALVQDMRTRQEVGQAA